MSLLTGDPKRSAELVPIADRMRYLQVLRLACVAAVAVYGLAYSGSGLDLPRTALISMPYLAFAFGAQFAWRLSREGGVYLFGLTLLLDGLYLTGVSYATGWLESPLVYLLLVHLIAVSLLASYRTGVKLALWDSLLLLMVHEAQGAGILHAEQSASFGRLAVLSAVFLVVAGATASFSAVNERELRRRRYDLEALARMARQLEESTGSAAAAEVLVSSVANAYDFERAVLLASSDGETLAPLAFHGDLSAAASLAGVGEASVITAARERREVQLVSHLDPAQDPWLDALIPAARKIAVFPLTVEGRSLGVLCAEHSMRQASRIERRVVNTIERFVSHGALALRNAWLLEQIQEIAQTDGLTGVGNRDSFENRLRSELARGARHGQNVSLLMIDVDHFKRLNDDFGHLVGDEVLRRVGRQLKEACREFDSIARYGGEEFAVVLPRTDTEEALIVAHRMRRLVKDALVGPTVTVSVGVATFPVDGIEPADLVGAADVALYRSKRAGRDQVTAAAVPLLPTEIAGLAAAPDPLEHAAPLPPLR